MEDQKLEDRTAAMTEDELFAWLDQWADEEFAAENEIAVEEIPAFIAAMREGVQVA